MASAKVKDLPTVVELPVNIDAETGEITSSTPFDDVSLDTRFYKGVVEHRTEVSVDEMRVIIMSAPDMGRRTQLKNRARFAWENRRSETNPENIVVYLPQSPYVTGNGQVTLDSLLQQLRENPDRTAFLAGSYKKSA